MNTNNINSLKASFVKQIAEQAKIFEEEEKPVKINYFINLLSGL